VLCPAPHIAGTYLPITADGMGTRTTLWHFSCRALLPVNRPDASRRVPDATPDEPLMVSLPVSFPDASRYWVLLPDPAALLVSALPARRPLASR
jgi:hypothetical protein